MQKQLWIIFNVLMETRMDQDENGIAQRQEQLVVVVLVVAEQLVQQRMSAMLTTLFSASKEIPYTKDQTTQLKHLGLCAVACIPASVNDADKLKQRLIEVLAGCMQQTVVDEATGERKRTSWVCSRVK